MARTRRSATLPRSWHRRGGPLRSVRRCTGKRRQTARRRPPPATASAQLCGGRCLSWVSTWLVLGPGPYHSAGERQPGHRADGEQWGEPGHGGGDGVRGGVWRWVGGQGQEQAAERRHADHLAELQRGGEQAACVGRLGQRNVHQGVCHQRAVSQAQARPERQQHNLQLQSALGARAEVGGQSEVGCRSHEKSGRRECMVDSLWQFAPVEAAEPERGGGGRKGQAGAQRAVAETGLEVPASVHGGQCSSCPSTSGSTMRNTAGTAVVRPIRSSRRVRRFPVNSSAGTTRGTSAATASPMGTLTRKTGRHSLPSRFALTNTPPITWPATKPLASTAV